VAFSRPQVYGIVCPAGSEALGTSPPHEHCGLKSRVTYQDVRKQV
jgi:hypothetical protein